jgi:hypothetical protein
VSYWWDGFQPALVEGGATFLWKVDKGVEISSLWEVDKEVDVSSFWDKEDSEVGIGDDIGSSWNQMGSMKLDEEKSSSTYL